MNAEPKTTLEWKYEPVDFFENEIHLELLDGEVKIARGNAKGVFPSPYLDHKANFRDNAHEALRACFLAQAVQIGKSFVLHLPGMTVEYPGGRRGPRIFCESITLRVELSSPDISIKDAEGNVIGDTRAERLASQAQFRHKVATLYPGDPTLQKILHSFNTAQMDKENFLVHLYEIVDSLRSQFGSESEARSRIGISKSEWSAFGKLANDEPVREGRHRGKHSQLRSCTNTEILSATAFAKRLIEKYVEFKIL